MIRRVLCFFFFNDTATTEIYTLSLHDALPICKETDRAARLKEQVAQAGRPGLADPVVIDLVGKTGLPQLPAVVKACEDRKSTRLNSSHANISYAVFCLKKKKHVLRLLLTQ